jgi:beta-lactamase regulating signal transducer with metallopeptidase domain
MMATDSVNRVERLAAVLLDFAALEIVYSTLLCLVVLGLALFLKGRLPVLQYWLWALVMLRLVLPPGLASPWSLRSLLERGQTAFPIMEGALPIWEGSHERDTVAALPERHSAPSWRGVALALWLGGSLLFVALLARRLRFYRNLIRRAAPVRDEWLLSRLRWWRSSFKIRRRIRLVGSEASLSPFTIGILRPVIYLPAAIRHEAEPAVAESVIAHEMAHIKRWDDLWLRLQNVIQVIYFFHPVAWIAASRMNDQRERICDQLVLSRGCLSARSYGRSLLTVLKLDLREPQPVAALGNNQKRRFSMRIRHILDDKISNRPVLSITLALAVGLLLLPMADSGAREVGVESAIQRSLVQMTHPLPEGRVSSGFGERKDPFTGKPVDHPGVDIAAPRGMDILAPAEGVVEIADTRYSGGAHFGTVIIVDHGNELKTFYAHLGSLNVAPGDHVRGGEPIATVGSTGDSTGPHLHFEVWQSGNPVDPLRFIDR